jgi:hypothetical protein
LKVRLGTFARSTIESVTGCDVVAGTQAALHHYTRRLRSGVPPTDFPRFCTELPAESAGAVFEVPVGTSIEESLKREVERQGTTLEQLAAHAVLVYLADLDRGFSAELEPVKSR